MLGGATGSTVVLADVLAVGERRAPHGRARVRRVAAPLREGRRALRRRDAGVAFQVRAVRSASSGLQHAGAGLVDGLARGLVLLLARGQAHLAS